MALGAPDRHAIGQDLMRAQWRWPVGMPLCRPMGQGLWEIRTGLPSNRIARVLICLYEGNLVALHGFMICLYEGNLVALHGFIKKTQKTPDDELTLARKRQKELQT